MNCNTDTKIHQDDLEKLQTLWKGTTDQLKNGSQAALTHFMGGLRGLLGAVDCQWCVAYHGQTPSDVYSIQIFDGWWVIDLHKPFQRDFGAEDHTPFLHELFKKHGPDPQISHSVARAGQLRVDLRQDTFSDEEWETHWRYREFLEPFYGVKERAHAVYSIDDKCECYFVLDRQEEQGKFTERERHLAYLALSGIPQLHRRLAFVRGLLPPASKILSPRERETLSHLLGGRSEKEIAEVMELSVHTVHQYITGLYRIFQCRGRAGLLALALNA